MTIRQCPCGKLDQLRRGRCHACYERDRRAGRIESLVSTVEVRGHIVMLRVNGWRYREIARAAGVDRSQVAWIVARGRQRVTTKTAVAICAVDPATRDDYLQNGWTEERRRTQRYPEWTDQRRREQPVKAWRTRRHNLGIWTHDELQEEWALRHPMRQPIPKPGEWTAAALCAQIDQEMFFPEKGGDPRPGKKVCQACEVRQKCLDFALEHDIDHGIFGGLSAQERKRLQRTRGEESSITA